MSKIKFIGILILIIVLFQIPCLIKHEDIYSTLSLIITIVIWIIGTRKIEKNTALKCIMIYGFIVLWCGLTLLAIYSTWGKKIYEFSILDAGWVSSPFLIFIISKIVSSQTMQEKIDYGPKFFIITMVAMLLIGALIECGLEYAQYTSFLLLETMYYLDISIFSIVLFCTLNINSIDRKIVILCTIICIIINCIINIIPLKKINSIITFEEELIYEIQSNMSTYTYKNIAVELGKYLPTEEPMLEEPENLIWNYQQYAYAHNNSLYVIKGIVQSANIKNFKEVKESIANIPDTFKAWSNMGKLCRNYRVASMTTSSIIIIGMGCYLVLRKDENKC